jgi:beta-lactamase regulating signal transducer with metallopeptidase domain
VIIPYLLRLCCLSLACFFLVHLFFAALVLAVAPAAQRAARVLDARSGARLLFSLRLLPGLGSVLVIAGLCVPSYLFFEPRAAESVGLPCIAAALLAVAAVAFSAFRVIRAATQSRRYIRACRSIARTGCCEILLADSSAPVLALTGILRPRLIVSQRVLDRLPADEFDAALRHEAAHHASRDNLKRLLLGLAPFAPALAGLEREWARCIEWAADDRAVAGDRGRSVSLAAALVSVARLGNPPRSALIAVSLLAGTRDLAERVERLLNPAPAPPSRQRAMPVLAAVATAALVAVACNPAALEAVHELLEHLV